MKPLSTKIHKLKIDIQKVFEIYDKDKNYRLSAEELCMGLSRQGIKLEPEETKCIKDYFHNRFQSSEISLENFRELMRTKFKRQYDKNDARKAL